MARSASRPSGGSAVSDVVCFGEVLIDFVPTVTPTTLIDAPAFKKAPGGAPANVAVGLTRLGVSSAFIGMVGEDPFGTFLEQTLRADRVDTSGLRTTPKARTALAFVSLKPDGDREFMFYRHPSADMLMEPDDVDARIIRAAQALHFGSISLISEPSRSATLHAIDVARDAGCQISCDPNLRLPLWPGPEAARTGLRQAIAAADIVKVSDDEVKFLEGSSLSEAVRALWGEHTKLIVMTSGADGCRFFGDGFEGEVKSFAVESVDTTGAGDGFVAGLLQGLITDPEAVGDRTRIASICRKACAVGALATTGRGAIPSLPTSAQVAAFLQQNSHSDN